MTDEPTNGPIRRARPRVRVRFETQFRGRRTDGRGTVRNISTSGALIEPAKPLPLAGTRLVLRFSFYEGSVPIDVPARVVRETPGGFAVEFLGMDERTRSLLGLAIGKLLSQPSTSQPTAAFPDSDDDEPVTLMKLDT